MSTPGDIQHIGGYYGYTRGYPLVHRRVLSTLGGYNEYTRGCPVPWMDTISRPEAYHDECWDITVTQRDFHDQYIEVSIQIQWSYQPPFRH